MDWRAIVGTVVSIWVFLCCLTEGRAITWTTVIVLYPPLWLYDSTIGEYRRRQKPCACGRMPPQSAKWCPLCGLDVRAWRENGVRARRG